ncbi:hypothetical protein [Phenylobacterium sp.]|uniref:hypothetical protein n=1 Tax=Phenylobacterium sp. TaxID=1871053 RepID=UPI0025CDCDA4|nr:hypothetical protein [Phenylobacterium sp.]
MDRAQLKAIERMFEKRTAANTASPKAARDWILRDGVHRPGGFLVNASAKDRPTKPAK